MAEGRVPGQKRERPRDELGRPLPWGERNRLEMEDFDAHTLEENHQLGIQHFDAGRFFPAHEAWETAWKQARGTPEEEFFKGLSQLGAGYVHYRRSNPHGAHVLIRRAMSRVERYGARHRGIDVRALLDLAGEHAKLFEAADREGRELPPVTTPRVGSPGEGGPGSP
jgi:predicted metal-dependent hydrolase